MTHRYHIDTPDRLAGMRSFLSTLLQHAGIDAVLVPTRLTVKDRIMPELVADPNRLADADPLSPAFPVNGAQQLAKLTRMPSGGRLAAVLRPCEIRAFNELVKLNQGSRDAVLIVGLDCPGALSNADFRTFADRYDTLDAATREFCKATFSADTDQTVAPIAPACRACTRPVPDGADIAVELFGAGPGDGLSVHGRSGEGETALAELDFPAAGAPSPQREKTLSAICARREQARAQMVAAVTEATASLHGLAGYLADCVNCYNCRVACPVCYCTTCVFTTDTFRHESFQYLQWARRKGGVKMPTDTLFFHLTRMAHMSTACVGCGQCANACPNDIPLADLFISIGDRTQAAFDYTAGLDLSQAPPMNGFERDEYPEVVGFK